MSSKQSIYSSIVVILLAGASQVSLAAAPTERVSVGPAGAEANGASSNAAVSADGRFVAFSSAASNLVADDANNLVEVFVHDRQSGSTERISLSSSGEVANDSSFARAISADGRFVVFVSPATNLVPGDTNADHDVFVRDRVSGLTERVSVASDGAQADSGSFEAAISADGRFVAFQSYAHNLVPGFNGIYVHDRATGTTECVSYAQVAFRWGSFATKLAVQSNGNSTSPSISADGRFVAFESVASNLVARDTNDTWDIFVYDRQTGATERVSVGPGGVEAAPVTFHGHDGAPSFTFGSLFPSISADGRFVAFQSWATNLVPADTNNKIDVFVHDRFTHQTELMSFGEKVVSVGHRQIRLLAEANGDSFYPTISADGRFVAFSSSASTLVERDSNGNRDIFVRDRIVGTIERASVSEIVSPLRPTFGVTVQANQYSDEPAISADGHLVAFKSAATNLARNDGNNVVDVFVRSVTVELEETPLPVFITTHGPFLRPRGD